jgi:hypothetical protein
MIDTPMPMPNNALTGNPIASTEPKATMRMMMAGEGPSTSTTAARTREDLTAELDRYAVDRRRSRSISCGDLVGVANEMLSNISTLRSAISGFGSLERDLRRATLHVRARGARDVGDRRDLGEERLHLLLHFGVGDALLGPEHDRADLTGTLAPELCVEDVEAATRLDVRKAELISARRADRAGGGSDEHEEPDPDAEHQPSVVVTPRSQSQEQDGPPEIRSTLCRVQALTSRRE